MLFLYVILGLIVGVILGLIGGGGTIITLPILVYLFKLDPTLAVSYTLFIVGTTSLVASVKNVVHKNIDFKVALLFAFPAFIVVYIIRKHLFQLIPEVVFTIGSHDVKKEFLTMLLFAVLMLFSSISMIKGRKEITSLIGDKQHYGKLFFQGVFVGSITGLVGAAGGFLIVPALVFMARLPIKKAIATSLMVITINSFFGFLGDVKNVVFDWELLAFFTLGSVSGVFIGSYINSKINSNKLRKVFGWFVLIMGIFVLVSEILKYSH